MRNNGFKTMLASLTLAATAAACGHSDTQTANRSDSILANATREELQQAVSERDQLLSLYNEMMATMDTINRLEGIVTIAPMGENPQAAGIRGNLEAMRATLEYRRQRLDELEAQLRQSNTANQDLLATVSTMRGQLEMQAQQLEMLSVQLQDANREIGTLRQENSALADSITQVAQDRDAASAEAERQVNINNECYYAVGSKTELKDHNIIEGGGFLRKTRIMQGEFDRSFFIQADKRTLTLIPLHSRKAKVLTTAHPAGSYEIIENDGQKELRILNPAEFWGVSNFLVIQID